MKKIITTPISLDSIRDLRIGDIIYLTGTLVTGRDDVHLRVVKENMVCPFDFDGMAIMHAGPIIKEGPEENTMIAIGPTSSIRMDEYAGDFIRMTGLKMMVGKGGMGVKTSNACKEFGAIHCMFPGGCAVIAASCVEKITNVYWRELGMPEALWEMKVKEFGPLIVTIDTTGGNLFLENKAYYASRLEECKQPVLESVKDIMHIHASK